MPQGSWFKAHGAWPTEIWGEVPWAPGPRAEFLLAMSLEPGAWRHEPLALSHEPLTIHNRLIDGSILI